MRTIAMLVALATPAPLERTARAASPGDAPGNPDGITRLRSWRVPHRQSQLHNPGT